MTVISNIKVKMGDFRIVIDCVGGHGQDREKKDGETVDFSKGGEGSPEAVALRAIEDFKKQGMTPEKAYIIHWPIDNYGGQLLNKRSTQIVDDLLTGNRTGSF